jgi:hypothetical protein
VERAKLDPEIRARLQELAEGGASAMEIVFAMSALQKDVDPLEVIFPEDKMDPPSSSATSDEGAAQAETAFTAELERGFAHALPSLGLHVRRVLPGAVPDAPSAMLDVRYGVRMRRQLGRAPIVAGLPRSFWELTFTFEVAPPGDAKDGAAYELTAHPPRDFSCIHADDVYAAQRRAAFHLLAERLSAGLVPPPDGPAACPRAEVSPPAGAASRGLEYLQHLKEMLGRKPAP